MTVRLVPGADAEFAINIPHTGIDVAFGYAAGTQAARIWSSAEWDMFPGFKVPICVPGTDVDQEAQDFLAALQFLGVPAGKIVTVDAETRTDAAFFVAFGNTIVNAGYKLWTYGSESTVYTLPRFNGIWVAKWGGNPAILVDGITRAAQVRANVPPGYDVDFVHEWTLAEMWQ